MQIVHVFHSMSIWWVCMCVCVCMYVWLFAIWESVLFTQSCPTISSIQLLSHVWLFATPWTTTHLPIHHQLLELAQIHVHQVSDAICPPLLLLPSIFPSIRVFSNESVLPIRWPKYWSFSFSISLSNEYSGLISFRVDWLDLLTVQGTLKSLLQHHRLKASILCRSAFFVYCLIYLPQKCC